MIGNLRWNLVLSTVGFIITMSLSLMSNVWLTSLYRGLYCFVILFVLGFVMRSILAFVFAIGKENEHYKGQHIDLATPDEETDRLLETEQEKAANEYSETQDEPQVEDAFAPLDPPRLMSKEENDVDAAQVVNAIRHMSEGEGR